MASFALMLLCAALCGASFGAGHPIMFGFFIEWMACFFLFHYELRQL